MTLDDPATVALVIARGLHFCATAVLWGGGGLMSLLPRRAPTHLFRLAAWLAAVSGLAWLASVLALVTGDPASLADASAWSAFWASSFGPPWALRVALVIVCAIVACFAEGRATTALLALGGGALAIDQAWLGHAATGMGATGNAMLATQAAHTLAAYAWTGALPVLGLLLFHGDKRAERAVALFSTIGVLIVATIVATGFLNASYRIGDPAEFVTTPYGRLVLFKAVLVLVMIVVAWINRSFTTSARRVLIETATGAVVLGIAAVLGVSAPPE